LASYGRKGINTVSGVVARWAPASDGNNTNNYAGFVARKLGVDPNAPIDLSNPAVRQKLIPAMSGFEGQSFTPQQQSALPVEGASSAEYAATGGPVGEAPAPLQREDSMEQDAPPLQQASAISDEAGEDNQTGDTPTPIAVAQNNHGPLALLQAGHNA